MKEMCCVQGVCQIRVSRLGWGVHYIFPQEITYYEKQKNRYEGETRILGKEQKTLLTKWRENVCKDPGTGT